MQTPEGRLKAEQTLRQKYGVNYREVMGSMGAKARKKFYLPMKDPDYARKLQQLSVEKRRINKQSS